MPSSSIVDSKSNNNTYAFTSTSTSTAWDRRGDFNNNNNGGGGRGGGGGGGPLHYGGPSCGGGDCDRGGGGGQSRGGGDRDCYRYDDSGGKGDNRHNMASNNDNMVNVEGGEDNINPKKRPLSAVANDGDETTRSGGVTNSLQHGSCNPSTTKRVRRDDGDGKYDDL